MQDTATSPHRERDAERLFLADRGLSAWQRLCPNDAWRDAVLLGLEEYLDTPEVREAIWELEGREAYPRAPLDGMRDRGLMTIFAPEEGGVGAARVTAYHQCALNASNARRNTSLAVTISVNSLALLAAYVAATPEQFERINARVQGGAFSSLLLSELSHGSNLLANRCRAERGTLDEAGEWIPVADDEPCTHYRLSGEKDLINGANEHDLLFPFLRTRNFDGSQDPAEIKPLEARADFSMFWLERTPEIAPLPRWKTLPAQGADISGLDFNGAVVSADRVLGREHGGMKVAQKTLILSRGGVASLAAGCLNGARDMAAAYAARRAIYGQPIHTLGAIADHLLRIEALDRLVSAISLRTAALMNAYGIAVSHYTAVAKVLASGLAEEGVTEGKKVLGARALLRDFPYARYMQDVVLYAVFDGTTHLMYQELSHRLAQEARREGRGAATEDTLERMRAVYAKPATPVYESLKEKHPRFLLPLERHLELLGGLPGEAPVAALSGVCRLLFACVRACDANGAWKAEQHLRLRAAELYATLEGLVAYAELADPPRRAALGVSPIAEARALDAPLASFTVSWIGRRVVAGVRELALDAGLPADWAAACAASLSEVEGQLAAGQVAVRQACREALVEA
ncbi:MAG: acyl-CoA/acyl-ACP dehydrogenase [Planctomycetes bacterium]|nr:acyl-CoA/acyl-ACP dehydrogenase [Planctomycetota bacterium]